MANGNRRPLAPVRKVIAAVLGTVAVFVVLFGLGMTSLAIVALGVALLVLAIGLVAVNAVRGGARAWAPGTAHVQSVSEPPPSSTYGRCELQIIIDAPGLPARMVKVRDPRVPVAKWPDVGATLPIMVAIDDPRHVRILWDDVMTHAEAAGSVDDLPDEGDPFVGDDDRGWRRPGAFDTADLTDDLRGIRREEPVVVRQTSSGHKVVEGTVVDPQVAPLPRRAGKSGERRSGPTGRRPSPGPGASRARAASRRPDEAAPDAEPDPDAAESDREPVPTAGETDDAGRGPAAAAGVVADPETAQAPAGREPTDPEAGRPGPATAAAAAAGLASDRPADRGTGPAAATRLAADHASDPDREADHGTAADRSADADRETDHAQAGRQPTDPEAGLAAGRPANPDRETGQAGREPTDPEAGRPGPATPADLATDRPADDARETDRSGDAARGTDQAADAAGETNRAADDARATDQAADGGREADRAPTVDRETRSETTAGEPEADPGPPGDSAEADRPGAEADDPGARAAGAATAGAAAGLAAATGAAAAAAAARRSTDRDPDLDLDLEEPPPLVRPEARPDPGDEPVDEPPPVVPTATRTDVVPPAGRPEARPEPVETAWPDDPDDPGVATEQPQATARFVPPAARRPADDIAEEEHEDEHDEPAPGRRSVYFLVTEGPTSPEPATAEVEASDEELDELITAYPSARPGDTGVIHGIGLTMLVTNLARSVDFYRDTLGFQAIDSGDRNAILASGDTRIVLREIPEVSPITRRPVHLNLEVGDVLAVYENLRAKGIKFTYAPKAVNRGAKLELWAATFRDPDGHGIAITQWRSRVQN